jgi:hypothetical protein
VVQVLQFCQGAKMPSFSNIFEWGDKSLTYLHPEFYECVLLRAVGEFEARTKFHTITWDEETLTLRFYLTEDEDEPVMAKTLGLVD